MIFMVVGILCAAVGHGQQPASKPSIYQLLKQLQSDQWADRAAAYENLRSDSKELANPNVQEALLAVLDRENRLVESTLRDSHEREGVSEKFGEEFGEYLGELSETVDSFANWNDSRQVCMFVHESYNPQSKFAAKIATHAKVAVPCLIEMYGSDVGLTRAKATSVLVQALARAKDEIDPIMVVKINQVIASALSDRDDGVRSSCVRALAKFGGVDMIPLLEQVAESDHSPEVHGYSIRKSASEAIATIQEIALK